MGKGITLTAEYEIDGDNYTLYVADEETRQMFVAVGTPAESIIVKEK